MSVSTSFTYINGNIIPSQKATIPVGDRGLRFGDGVFETIRITAGIPYQWESHLGRLEQGLSALKINLETQELLNNALSLIKKNEVVDGILRIMVTRGEGSVGYLPLESCSPNVIIEAHRKNFPTLSTASLLVSKTTKFSANNLPIGIKHMQGLNSILAKMEARDQQCDEALLLDDNSTICEAASGNIFWVKGNILHTPSLTCPMVNGTMRERVIALSPIQVAQGTYEINDIKTADEVFLTNASWPIMPIGKILPINVTFDTQHPIAKQLLMLIREDMQHYVDAWHAPMA